MGRKRFTKPVEQTTIHVSQKAYEFIENHRNQRLHEPRYLTIDRLIAEYEQQKETIVSLHNDIEEKDIIIGDLRDTSMRQWSKLQRLEAEKQPELVVNV